MLKVKKNNLEYKSILKCALIYIYLLSFYLHYIKQVQ